MAVSCSNTFVLGEDISFEVTNSDASLITATTTGTIYLRKNNLKGEVAFSKAMTLAGDRSNIFVKITPAEVDANLSAGKYYCIFDIVDGTDTRDIEHTCIELTQSGVPVA